MRVLLLTISITSVLSIEHDSVCDESKEWKCPEPSHTIMRLKKRDDNKAKEIAEYHGMEIVVCGFYLI